MLKVGVVFKSNFLTFISCYNIEKKDSMIIYPYLFKILISNKGEKKNYNFIHHL